MKIHNANKIRVLTVVAMLTVSSYAVADRDRSGKHFKQYDYARVISSTPVYEIVKTAIPSKQCWQQPVTRSAYRSHDTAASTLAGGLIGGIIGHQFGGGNGKKLATAVGTLVGAQIAHDNARHTDDQEYVSYRDVCEVSHRESYEKVISGYDVEYRYHGRVYDIRMPYEPGKRIKLKVSMNPVF